MYNTLCIASPYLVSSLGADGVGAVTDVCQPLHVGRGVTEALHLLHDPRQVTQATLLDLTGVHQRL